MPAIVMTTALLALFGYLLQVPANRIGYATMSLPQLKILQEAITLTIFVPFVILYMRQPVRLDYPGRRSAWWRPSGSLSGGRMAEKKNTIEETVIHRQVADAREGRDPEGHRAAALRVGGVRREPVRTWLCAAAARSRRREPQCTRER